MTVNQKKEESRNNEIKKTLKMTTNILEKEEQIAGLDPKIYVKKTNQTNSETKGNESKLMETTTSIGRLKVK